MTSDRYKRATGMPVYRKAEEMLEYVLNLVEYARTQELPGKSEVEKQVYEERLGFMRGNAMLIPAKIVGAESGQIYDLKMENAALIRRAARELLTETSGLRLDGFQGTEYLQVLRDTIDEFRVLFAEWVKTFDQYDYIIDRWGLFNPPGVNYDDHDPDDDIPREDDPFADDDLSCRTGLRIFSRYTPLR